MKSYTDLEQSRKLAEKLPIESADMYYCYGMDIKTKEWSYDNTPTIIDEENKLDIGDMPCWSLAALINILPRIDIEKEIKVNCSDDTFDYRVKAYIGDGYIGDWFDNLVDTCVAMIEKLHNLNLL